MLEDPARLLADELWDLIPDTADGSGEITLPAPLILGIYQFLRHGRTDYARKPYAAQ